MGEKRKFIRLNKKFKIEYHLHKKKTSSLISVSENIGQGGICLILNEQIEKNTEIELRFYLPEFKELIACEGRVVWQNEVAKDDKKYYYTGVEFIDIEEQDKLKISRYIYVLLSARPSM